MAVAKKKTAVSVKAEKTAPVKKSSAKAVKAAPKAVKKVAAKEVAPKTEQKQASLKVAVMNAAGKVLGSMTLPHDIFGAKVNTQLLAQAVRVYLVNQRRGTVATKTRGEVEGSTRKIYRQKGTGRARHGGIRAPIFVKGGIAHGPKPKDYALSFPAKMKQKALIAALSNKAKEGNIKVVDEIEKLDKKTKEFAKGFKNWGFSEKKRSAIFVLPKDMIDVYKAMRNLTGVTVTTVQRLNTYDVLKHQAIVMTREAVDVLEEKLKVKTKAK